MNRTILACLFAFALAAATASAQGTSFTYEGVLKRGTFNSRAMASGSHDFAFTVFDASSNGAVVGATILRANVPVEEGVFRVTLDFGPGVFTGGTRWLEISVRASGSGAIETLSPRQEFTSAPYAVKAAAADTVTGPLPAEQITGELPVTTVRIGSIELEKLSDTVVSNTFWRLGGNVGTTAANFLGTTDNRPLEFRVNGLLALKIEPAIVGFPNLIGGYNNSIDSSAGLSVIMGGSLNSIGANSGHSVIGGGNYHFIGAAAPASTVGGGAVNMILNGVGYGTISGGYDNLIGASSSYATIGGGTANRLWANSGFATIAGGTNNSIGTNSYSSVIGGGQRNTIADNSDSAAIAGGRFNSIGTNSLRSAIGGGNNNGIAENSMEATIAGGHFNQIRASSPYSAIGGGDLNSIAANSSWAAIAGGQFNDIGTNSASSAIGGGLDNNIAANSSLATIAGGRSNDIGTNSNYSTIGGGNNNGIAASSIEATIAGGHGNQIGANSPSSAIGGGNLNNIGANSSWATIAGGQANTIGTNSPESVIGGGVANNIAANAPYAIIPGGVQNFATNFAFAAGRQAKANHTGAFVWADAQGGNFASTSNNQFLIRASGGVGIGNNNPQSELHVSGTVTADAFVGDGSRLLNVVSTAIVTNAIVDSQLPANVARLNTNQTFTASNTFSGVTTATNAGNQFAGTFHGAHTGSFTGDGGGLSNVWSWNGNSGTVPGTHFLGTVDDRALELRVNNQRAWRLEPNANSPNAVGGHVANMVSNGVYGAVIGGGGSAGSPNVVGGDYAIVAGGGNNLASGDSATVSGGAGNLSSGHLATVSGGDGNTSSGPRATVGGGEQNTASRGYATVGGGLANISSNVYATVPGGFLNIAGGQYSFAAGRLARASHDGAFVWSDPTGSGAFSTGTNQFLIRASGGVGIGTNNPQSALHVRGVVTADGFVGDGSGLTNLTIGAGSVPWANLTGVPAGFADGVDNDTTYTAGNGLTLAGTQFSVSNSVAQRGASNYFTSSNYFLGLLVATNASNQLGGSFNGIVSGNGAGLTNLNLGSAATNTAFLNSNQVFSASNAFSGVVTMTNGSNSFVGSFTGNGAGLTNLNAGALASGTVPDARLSNNVARLNAIQTFTGTNTFSPTSGAPFVVTSTTKVASLNADWLDGLDSSAFALSTHTHSATDITSGTLPDARLSNSVAMRVGSNYFTSSNFFLGLLVATNGSNQLGGNFNGIVSGNGAGLTNLPAATATNAWNLTGNAGTSPTVNFVGTTDGRPLILKSTGGIGIGTTNPTAPFNVVGSRAGNYSTPVTYIENTNTTGSSSPALRIGSSGNTADGVLNVSAFGTGKIAAFGANPFGEVVNIDTNGSLNFDPRARQTLNLWGANYGVGVQNNTLYARSDSGFAWFKQGAHNNLANDPGAGGLTLMTLDGSGNLSAYGQVGAASFSGNGALLTSVNADLLDGLDSTQFWKAGGNAGTTAGTHFLGTTDNQPVEFKANGARALRLEPNANSPNVVGGFSGNRVDGGAYGATVGGGGQQFNTNVVSANFGTVAGGQRNRAAGLYAAVGGGTENQATNSYATVAGGWANGANGYLATVGGGGHNATLGNWSSVGGGSWNHATNDGATIAGGENNHSLGVQASIGGGNGNSAGTNATVGGGTENDATGLGAVIGGGVKNVTGGPYGFIGGGSNNLASGRFSAVAGGWLNAATKDHATVPGGYFNQASGRWSTVGGGLANTASNDTATVPGGSGNVAGGAGSFAAGTSARALHSGDFVWSDAIGAITPFVSTGTNQFLVRASGGMGIGLNNPSAQLEVSSGGDESFPQARINQTNAADYARLRFTVGGDYSKRWDVASRSNSFVIYSGFTGTEALKLENNNAYVNGALVLTSDRNAKEHFRPVDARVVLEKVAALPMQEWNYRTDAEQSRHLGPMAQDFRAAFGLGADDKHIATVDADGVALAAIQGLNKKVEEKEARIQELEKSVHELKELVRQVAASQKGEAR
jgi:hypothetical protein